MEDERQQPDLEDVQGAHQSLSRTNRKTQHRKGYGGSKEVGPRRLSYNDVILAPTLMHFDPVRVNSGSSSDSSTGSGSRRTRSSGSYSSSSVGSKYQSRSRRASTSSRSSVYSASPVVSGTPNTPNTIYSGSTSGDDRRGYKSRSRSPSEAYSRGSWRSTSRSRSGSPYEEYSRGRSNYPKVGTSIPSNGKMGWFQRIKNKAGNMFHRHHPHDNIDVSTFREDGNARAHHRSKTGNPGNNGVLHRQSKEQKVTKNKRRTPVN
ncbi:hypothetical protein MKW92_016110 [Papaver armeniacum]|nr:hypothetical protein MKW92_016110 [Papaver armeniacum]